MKVNSRLHPIAFLRFSQAIPALQDLEVELHCTEYAVNKSSLILDSLITSLTNLVFVALDAGLKGFLDVNN